MCKVLVRIRRQGATDPSQSTMLETLSGRSSLRSSLGLSVQLCTSAMAGRRSCGVGQWISVIDCTNGDWKDLIGHLKSGIDQEISRGDLQVLEDSRPR